LIGLEKGLNYNMKVGIIGAGYWGINLVRNFYQLKVLKAVADVDTNVLSKVKDTFPGVEVTTDPDVIFDDPEINGVVIATPARLHFELSYKALRKGKDVMVEKPLALSVKEGEQLVAFAEKNNRIIMVGHLMLYHDGIRRLKDMIKAGELGDIYYFYSQRVNLGKIRSDEDALWSFGPHDVSIALYLFDEVPQKVSAVGAAYLQPGIRDVIFMTLYFAGNLMGHIHLSWLDPHKIRKLTIVGSKKMVVFDDMERFEKLKIYDKGVEVRPPTTYEEGSMAIRVGDIHIPKIDLREPLRNECMAFIKAMETRDPPITAGEHGLQVLRVLAAGTESLNHEGAPVTI